MASCQLRLFQPTIDLGSIIALEQECFSTHYGPAELLFDPQMIGIVATFEGGRIGAYCYLHDEGDQLEIYRVAVAKEFRRQGVALRLLEEAKKILVSSMAKSLLLEVEDSNEAALRLYAKAGFQIFHCRKAYYSDGHDALEMRFDKENG